MKKFTIVLTPTVLAELDELKANHRNEDVRTKAESLITRIKGYRNRGDLLTGAVLQKNVSQIRSVALEPNMSDSLPWLDAENKDDRFIASVIEVMRQHPHSPVVLITRDINMQNKASFASLPFDEPPTALAREGGAVVLRCRSTG
jgi:predicted ribonuclease YlaK